MHTRIHMCIPMCMYQGVQIEPVVLCCSRFKCAASGWQLGWVLADREHTAWRGWVIIRRSVLEARHCLGKEDVSRGAWWLDTIQAMVSNESIEVRKCMGATIKKCSWCTIGRCRIYGAFLQRGIKGVKMWTSAECVICTAWVIKDICGYINV